MNCVRNIISLFFCRTGRTTAGTFDVKFIIVFFRGKPSGSTHGVDIQVSARGTSNTAFRPKMVSLDVNSPSFNYKFPPPPLTNYGANEMLFILIKGVIGMRTRVKLTDFNSEACCDWLRAPYLNLTGTGTFTSYV